MDSSYNAIVISQFEAALRMFDDCVRTCREEHWDGLVAKYPFWQVAYHTLIFVDLYLSPTKEAFEYRDLHPAGWKEFDDEYPSRKFQRDEIVRYVDICRGKMIEIIGSETPLTLGGPSGFEWVKVSRAEMHLYNLRHLQHHTGQLGAYLRRVDPSYGPIWASAGWE